MNNILIKLQAEGLIGAIDNRDLHESQTNDIIYQLKHFINGQIMNNQFIINKETSAKYIPIIEKELVKLKTMRDDEETLMNALWSSLKLQAEKITTPDVHTVDLSEYYIERKKPWYELLFGSIKNDKLFDFDSFKKDYDIAAYEILDKSESPRMIRDCYAIAEYIGSDNSNYCGLVNDRPWEYSYQQPKAYVSIIPPIHNGGKGSYLMYVLNDDMTEHELMVTNYNNSEKECDSHTLSGYDDTTKTLNDILHILQPNDNVEAIIVDQHTLDVLESFEEEQ